MSDQAGTLIAQFHYHGPDDRTAMHMISVARLAYLEQAAQQLAELRSTLAILGACTAKSPACAAEASADSTIISGQTGA